MSLLINSYRFPRFSPAGFFANGEDGFYFDFASAETVKQDATGFTSVSAGGDPVGLAFDKALGGTPATRRNLLTYTEQLDNAAWTKKLCSIDADQLADPDGAMTMDLIEVDSGRAFVTLVSGFYVDGVPYFRAAGLVLAAGDYVFSAIVKAKTPFDAVQIRVNSGSLLNGGTNYANVLFDLANGVIVSAGSGIGTPSITALGGDYYRIIAPFTVASPATVHCGFWFWNSSLIASTAGTEGIYAGQFYLELASPGGGYQRVDAGTSGPWVPGRHGTQTTTGARPTWQAGGLLRGDGSDDNLLTDFVGSATGTLAVRCVYTAASDIAIGKSEASNGRCFLGTSADGYAAAGIGSQSLSTIVGSVDIRDTPVTHIVKWNGSTVTMKVNNETVYSAAQSGAVGTTTSLRLLANNANGVGGNFLAGDLSRALAINRLTTDAEDTSVHDLWSN